MKTISPNVVHLRLATARAACGHQTPYKMGAGGYGKWRPGEASDCSGFVSDVAGTQRAPKPGRDFWIETTAMCTAAKEGHVLSIVPAQAGCFVAYPDHGTKSGHCALVTGVQLDEDANVVRLIGIDCSRGSFNAVGDAIREHDITFIFKRDDAVYFTFRQDIQ